MAIRDGDIRELALSIDRFTDKAAIRNYLLQQWIIEAPATKYRYFVETLASGSRLYLYRPAPYNKGCDFVIYVENQFLHKNGNDKPPSFKVLLADLVHKKQYLTPDQIQSLIRAIEIVYNVGSYEDAILPIKDIPETGFSFEIVLKLLKWFFAEQDLTYWSGRGRAMLLEAIEDELEP